MSTEIQFELVSPEEKLVSEGVYLVEIPGDEGVFGVMSGHESLVSSLKPGVVRLHKEQGGEARDIFIAGGFADVTAKNCTVLAEEAIEVQNLDKDSLEQYLSNLNDDLGLADEAQDLERIKQKIEITKAKLAAVAA